MEPNNITQKLLNQGGSQVFRVVKDNRSNQHVNTEVKPPELQGSTTTSEQVNLHVSERRKSWGIKSGNAGKELRERWLVAGTQASKQKESQLYFGARAVNQSAIGVYSSSSDPVHVPSPCSKSAATIGAIKRETGAVGVQRQSSEKSVKSSTVQSISNSYLEKDGIASRESLESFVAISNGNHHGSRSFLGNYYGRRSNHALGHQKVSHLSKEWKPKSSKKSSLSGSGVTGTAAISVTCDADNCKDSEIDVSQVQNKLSQINNLENGNVIIAEHIQVTESDRCQLTFGSFTTEFDSSRNFARESHATEMENVYAEPSMSLLASISESSNDGSLTSKNVDLLADHVQNSVAITPASAAVSEQELLDKESSGPQNLDSHANLGLGDHLSSSYTPLESDQQHTPELPSLSLSPAYVPQTSYDMQYFRPTADETVQGQGLPSPQEALSSHKGNSIPASTITTVQQQPPFAQIYPQVHVSHFANLMPYRQFVSPVYVPPTQVPGYSSNPAYPHPANGSSYLLMQGGGSHLSANNLKYGIQHFKPVPGSDPTGFGNFTNPSGYSINAPGGVGRAVGHEELSQLQFKDGNLYVHNPQIETSEIWLQNGRGLPGFQSHSYYNMLGQTPHAAYLSSHAGQASFNASAAVPQSSPMHFPGLYHSQPTAIANSHHLGPAMGRNVGVGTGAGAVALGAQVGACQQPQLGHLDWTTNF